MAGLRGWYLKYRPCIVRITVYTREGDLSTGTGFHIGEGLIVTARHVIRDTVNVPDIVGEKQVEEDRRIQSITRELDGKEVTVRNAYFHPDSKADLAVLETDFEEYPFPGEAVAREGRGRKPVSIPIGCHVDDWINDKFILCKVLVMGYPNVPWAELKVLVAAEAEVNALIKDVRVPHPYYIVSSTARGGFSGAPVISDAGSVIGIVVEALYSDYKPEETGFNSAITIEPLMRILVNRGIRPACVPEDIWTRFLKS